MSERRPIFGFVRTGRPAGPLDGAAEQIRMVRIPGRGPVHLLALLVASALLVSLAASAVLAAVATNWLLVIPVAVLIATFTVLMLRAWTVGTYVNDAGLAVQRLLRTVSARWRDVEAVVDSDGRVQVRTRGGRVFETTIARRSLDILGRDEAYDMAKLQLQRWGERR